MPERSKTRVGFTGTRRGMTSEQKVSLRVALARLKASVVTHGDCLGADEDAHVIALELGIDVRKRPCNLTEQRAFTNEGEQVAAPEDPLVRNRKIVEDSDLLIATPGEYVEKLRSGTWATIRYARKARKPVIVIWPNGRA